MENEFKINDYLMLKLERRQTNIYVNDEKFIQCKYLLLNLETTDFEKFDEIESIDEAFELYGKEMEGRYRHGDIDAETEFIGHCSNLQAWHENDYDPRILHSSLSFPLLRALFKAGDMRALMVLKEEVFRRIEGGNENTITFFLEEEYLQLFTLEELKTMFDNIDVGNQNLLKRINAMINRKWLLSKEKHKKRDKRVITEWRYENK